jgi:2-polyprenyl-3-methyl-5-hydroxy-6-metoxy-1,4-benzoquinol methylase
VSAVSHNKFPEPFDLKRLFGHEAFRVDEYGIARFEQGPSSRWRGPALRELQKNRHHLAHLEQPLYDRALRELMLDIHREGCFALDLACGDGRFTDWLLSNGIEHVVAVDSHLEALESLSRHLAAMGWRQRVMLVHARVEQLEFQPGLFDLALSMGSIDTLGNDFETILRRVSSWLKPAATWIDSEPTRIAAAVLALLFESADDLNQLCESEKWVERFGHGRGLYRPRTNAEVDATFLAAGMNEVERHSMSLMPALLQILANRGAVREDELDRIYPAILKAFEELDADRQLVGVVVRKLRRAQVAA